MTETKAFVAGATGLTGRSVVEHLRWREVETVAHVRPDSSSLERWRARFEKLGAEVDTTPWDEAAMTETLRAHAPTIVFALLGTTRARAKRVEKAGGDPAGETYESVDYGLTALLRRAAEASGHRPRFVYLSAMGVREGTRNAYMAARARIERELREGALPYTVARPSFILGERDAARPGESVGAAIADGLLGVAGAVGARKLRDRYRSITGDELAQALVRLALDPDAVGRIVEADELR
ncbi:MAG TPA: NAD(P)H-binding protein [Sandaracinaceae bacterium LLY-WYZ-13_1]|nr:NAD(P)H-binding protein [Sandaracinaceae bacterium LLY-WYZ-13_1]